MITRRLTLSLLAGLSVLAGMAAAVLLLHSEPPHIQSGTLLARPVPVVDFSLTGDDGQPYTRSRLLGHWNLIYVGYTYCPDVCPTTLATLKQVYAKLGADAAKVKLLFLSVDPERDTPQRLAQYVHYFSPDFSAATGPKAQLDALGANLNFVYLKQPGATPLSYSMDHSAALILVNPQAELVGYVDPPIIVEALAADLRHLVGGQ